MGKKLVFDEPTEMLQHLLAEEMFGKFFLIRKDEKTYELYKSTYDVHLVCTIDLPTPTSSEAFQSAWAKLTCAGQYIACHQKDGSIVLK